MTYTKRAGNWVLKGYSKSNYWVYNLPYFETLLQFNDLNKAKEYFKYKTEGL